MYGWVRCRGYIRNSLYKINQVTSRHSGRTVQVRASLVYLLYERNPCYIQIPTTVQLYKAEEKSLFFHINCVCVLLYPEEYTCSFLENFTVLHSDPASQVFFIQRAASAVRYSIFQRSFIVQGFQETKVVKLDNFVLTFRQRNLSCEDSRQDFLVCGLSK